PYDWLFKVDPFAGTIEPIAASADLQSEGPFGLAANSHYLTMTVGCCTSYEVDALDLTRPLSSLKVLNKPSDEATLFTEGAAPARNLARDRSAPRQLQAPARRRPRLEPGRQEDRASGQRRDPGIRRGGQGRHPTHQQVPDGTQRHRDRLVGTAPVQESRPDQA